jgi:uncharacterized peroxidase-related enzyme
MPAAGRIPMLEREQVPPDVAHLYDALLATRGVVPNMFKTLANAPALALGFAGLLKAMLSDGALPGWYKELIGIYVSRLSGCEYGVTAHTLSARQKGAAEGKIAAVLANVLDEAERGPFSENEKAGFRAAEILHHSPHGVDDATFAALQRVFNDAQIVELFATIGAFEMFPRLIEGLQIPTTPVPAEALAGRKG